MSEETAVAEQPQEQAPIQEGITDAPEVNESNPTTSEETSGEGMDFLDFIADQAEPKAEESETAPEFDVADEPEPELTPTSEESDESPKPEEEQDYLDSFVADFPDADSLSDILDDKAVAKWGELRRELAEARSKASNLEDKIDTNETPALVPELEKKLQDATDRISEYENELAVARVEQSTEYKQTVTEPLNNIMSAAEALAERTGVDVNEVFAVFSEVNIERQNNSLERLTEEMGDRDKMMLYRMVDDSAAIFDRDAMLKDRAAEASVELDRYNEALEKEALEEYTLETRAAVNKVYDKFESVIPDLEGVDLGDLRNKTLDSDYVSLDSDHQAYALSAGNLLPSVVKAIRVKDQKIASLEKQLSTYQNSTPKAAQAGGSVSEPAQSPEDDNLGFFEAISKLTQ